MAQLEVARQRVAEAGEVGRRARLLPGGLAERAARLISAARRGGTRTAFSKSRRTRARAANVVGVGSSFSAHGSSDVEQAAELGVGQAAVRDRLERRGVVAAAGRPRGGIIVFWSQNSSAWICARSDRIAARARSARARLAPCSRPAARVDVVEQLAEVASCVVLGEDAPVCSRGAPSSAMLSATSRAPASSRERSPLLAGRARLPQARERGGVAAQRLERDEPVSDSEPTSAARSAGGGKTSSLWSRSSLHEHVAGRALWTRSTCTPASRPASSRNSRALASAACEDRADALGCSPQPADGAAGAGRPRRGPSVSNSSATRRRCSSTAAVS